MSDDQSTPEAVKGAEPTPEVVPPAAARGIRSGKLAGRSMASSIWVLTWPILLQQLMQACVGLVDKMLAGGLDPADRVPALDAVGVGSYIGWFIMIAMAGLGIGGQAIIARAMGSGSEEEAHEALGKAMSISLVWGTLVGVLLWFLVLPLASVTGLDERATAFCIEYVRILAISMPACAVMMVGGMCLHGAGETTRPSLIAIVVNVVNIAVSWLASGATIEIAGLRLESSLQGDLGVVGIAAGTAVSYVIGGGLTLLVLVRGVRDLELRRRCLGFRAALVRRIVRIGIPSFFEGISMWGVNVFVLMFIGQIARTMSGDGVASGLQGAHVIAVQWEAFSFLPGYAIGTAAGALAGQYLGAGDTKMARKAILICTGIGTVAMGSLGILYVTVPGLLTSLISREPIHMELVPPLLRLAGSVQLFFALTMVVRQGLRGVGDTTWTLMITTASSYLVRLPACWLLGIHFGLGLTGIWMGLCGEIVIRSILFAARLLHGGWARVRV